MTQLDQAREAVRALYRNPVDKCALALLHEVLGQAQNDPPLGAADGSLPEHLWNALRDLSMAFLAVGAAHAKLEAIKRGDHPRKHDFRVCPGLCDGCFYCAGGLQDCTICGGAESSLLPSCPGWKLNAAAEAAIIEGTIRSIDDLNPAIHGAKR